MRFAALALLANEVTALLTAPREIAIAAKPQNQEMWEKPLGRKEDAFSTFSIFVGISNIQVRFQGVIGGIGTTNCLTGTVQHFISCFVTGEAAIHVCKLWKTRALRSIHHVCKRQDRHAHGVASTMCARDKNFCIPHPTHPTETLKNSGAGWQTSPHNDNGHAMLGQLFRGRKRAGLAFARLKP